MEKKFKEKDGVIYLSVTSYGADGYELSNRNSFEISCNAKKLLRSKNIKPTTGVTYEVAILKSSLFEDEKRTFENARKEARKRGLVKPPIEVACLLHQKISHQDMVDMGFRYFGKAIGEIVVMHDQIKGHMLSIEPDPHSIWLRENLDSDPKRKWCKTTHFAFIKPSVVK